MVLVFHDIGPAPMSAVHDNPTIFASFFYDDPVKSEDMVVADHGAVRRHVARHHRVRAYGGAAANAQAPDHLRAGTDRDIVLDHRGTEQTDLLHHRHAAAEQGALFDHDAERI